MKEVKFKRWSEFEDNFLIENCKTMSPAQMAKKLGRTENTICWRLSKFGIRKKQKLVKDPVKKISDFDYVEKLAYCLPWGMSYEDG